MMECSRLNALGIKLAFCIGFLSFAVFAQQAVLIEDQGRATFQVKSDAQSPASSGTVNSASGRASSDGKSAAAAQEWAEEEDFETAADLRSKKRVGAGVLAAGQLGLVGALVELNYNSQNAAVIGFGGGPRYSSITMQYKHHFGGKALTPFASIGYSRWYNNTKSEKEFQSSTPGFLAGKYLSEEERKTGLFGKDFIAPGAGIQYTQLFGKALGTSVFAEILFLLDTSNFNQVATGSMGFLYYF